MIAQNQKEFLINRIVDKLTEFLVIDSNVNLTEALKVVYNSRVYQQLLIVVYMLKVLLIFMNF